VAAIEHRSDSRYVVLTLAQDRLGCEEDFGIAATAELVRQALICEVDAGCTAVSSRSPAVLCDAYDRLVLRKGDKGGIVCREQDVICLWRGR
jgi:hypothetical protein